MARIDERRKQRLEQALRDMGNYGSAHARSKSTEMQEYFLSTKSEGRYYTSRATYRQCLKGIIIQYRKQVSYELS